jgi:hypothetical protein
METQRDKDFEKWIASDRPQWGSTHLSELEKYLLFFILDKNAGVIVPKSSVYTIMVVASTRRPVVEQENPRCGRGNSCYLDSSVLCIGRLQSHDKIICMLLFP